MTTPNPKQAMGDEKIQLQIVPEAATIAIAMGLAEGARKYGPWNWRDQPVQLMTYVGSAKRHLAAWIEGEDIDPDGYGKTHLDGAIACLAIIIDALSCGNPIDDRPRVKNNGVLKLLSIKRKQENAEQEHHIEQYNDELMATIERVRKKHLETMVEDNKGRHGHIDVSHYEVVEKQGDNWEQDND